MALRAAPSAHHRVAVADGRFGAARPGRGDAFEPAALATAQSPAGGSASLRQGTKQKSHPRVAFCFCILGGERGIRTPDRFDPIHAFQACDFNRSSTSPAFPKHQEAPDYSKHSREYQHYSSACHRVRLSMDSRLRGNDVLWPSAKFTKPLSVAPESPDSPALIHPA